MFKKIFIALFLAPGYWQCSGCGRTTPMSFPKCSGCGKPRSNLDPVG